MGREKEIYRSTDEEEGIRRGKGLVGEVYVEYWTYVRGDKGRETGGMGN